MGRPTKVLNATSETIRANMIQFRKDLEMSQPEAADAAGIEHHEDDVECPEERADAFAAELLAPLHEVRRRVVRRPEQDRLVDEHSLYQDQADRLASRFGVPVEVIDGQIRRLAR